MLNTNSFVKEGSFGGQDRRWGACQHRIARGPGGRDYLLSDHRKISLTGGTRYFLVNLSLNGLFDFFHRKILVCVTILVW